MQRLTAIALVFTMAFAAIACTRGAPAGPTGTPPSLDSEQAGTPEPTAAPTGALAPATQATPDPTVQAYLGRFAGTWDTNWGTMVLTVTVAGITVTGVYEYAEGRIEAVLSADGRTMEGTWQEEPSRLPPDDAGRVVFTLSKDGNSLNGYWWHGQDEDGGEWTGTRVEGSGIQEATSAAADDEAPPGEATATPEAADTGEATVTPEAADTGEATATPEAADTGEAGITLSSNPDNDLLFYVTDEGGGRVYYYGTETNGTMRLSHIVLDDGAGNLNVIIYEGRLVPVQWILPQATVAVYPVPEGEEAAAEDGPWFDPHQAFHVVLRGQQEHTVTADIYPGDLGAVLDELEGATGQRFDGARAFLAAHDVTFEELVALACQGGSEQPLYIAAAAGFGAAAAALGLERAAGEMASLPRAPGLAAPRAIIFGEVIKVGAGAAGGVLADMLGKGLDPGDGPSVGVLLCRGAAKYGVCHYMFFHRSRLGDCIALCQTSLGCFTDICMPMDISAEMAMGMGGGF